MDKSTLSSEQERIFLLIDERAKEKGLATSSLRPMFDGVSDIDAYLRSSLKIAWVLKEPYDEPSIPSGGGWSPIAKEFIAEHEKRFANPTWRNMASVLHGFRHGHLLDGAVEKANGAKVIDEIKSIAWINLSKMPGTTQSNDAFVASCYQGYWKDIVARQLTLFSPEVIICGGTFGMIRDSFPNAVQDLPLSTKFGIVRYWRNGAEQILLDTDHPSFTRRRGYGKFGFLNALIAALQTAAAELQAK
jgi:hypothetical protein